MSLSGLPEVPDSRSVPEDDYRFRLYLTGATPASRRALVNARQFCERCLAGRYRLEILDISEHIDQAIDDQIVAAPTLLKLEPLPLQRFIGDLSDTQRLETRLRPSPRPI